MSGGGHAGNGTGDPFVGRSDELRTIGERVSDVLAGVGSFVVITGPAGIGKSRVLDRATAVAKEGGVRIAVAGGMDLAGVAPFGSVAAALNPLLEGVEPWRLRRLGEERLKLVSRVLPSLGAEPEREEMLEPERWRLHRVLRDLLELLAEEQPLMLCLDDLHVADTATAEFVAYLLRRAPPPRLMGVFAYRGQAAPEVLVRAAEAAALDDLFERFDLAPLTEPEADLLLAEMDRATRRALHDYSGGNPLFLAQLAGQYRKGSSRLVDGTVPEPIQAVLSDELRELDARTRRMLAAGAVFGEEFDVDVAAELVALSDADALAAYDIANAHDLLRPAPAARLARFRHPLLRRVVYDLIPENDRRHLHERAAAALAPNGSRWAIAYHVARSAARGDRSAIEQVMSAGHAAARHAPADAAEWFSRARRLLPHDASAAQRIEVLVPLARALATSGRVEEGTAVLAEALALSEGALPATQFRILALIGQLGILSSRHIEACDLLEDALARATELTASDLCALRISLAINHLMVEEVNPDTSLARDALALAHRSGSPTLLFTATAVLAFIHHQRTEIDRSKALSSDALDAFDELGDAELAPQLDGISLLGLTLSALERYREAARVLERGLAIARAAGAAAWFVRLLNTLAHTRRFEGRLVEAAGLAEETVEASLITGNEHTHLWALTARSSVALERGWLERALDASQDAVALARRHPLAMYGWTADLTMGVAMLELGRFAAAREALLVRGSDLATVPGAYRGWFYAMLSGCELGLGKVEAARAWVERAEAIGAQLRREGLVVQAAVAEWARAGLLLAEGDHRAAGAYAEHAAKLQTEAGVLLYAARSHLLAGTAYQAAGATAAAISQLRSARALASETGNAQVREFADQALARLGERPAPSSVVHQVQIEGDLTTQERTVAKLIADGQSNREIAAELNLSDRTIERHITTVRRKLGVSSRSAVASLVGRDREYF